MDIKRTVGTRINSALARCGMLQKDLAKILGVTDNTISYYCKGTRGPKLEQIPIIAKSLNTTTDYLFGLTDDPDIQKSAVDDLGLTPTVISNIRLVKEFETSDCNCLAQANQVLENMDTWLLLFLIHNYMTAAKVDKIHDSIADKCNDFDELSKALTDAAMQYKETDIDMYDFLLAKAQIYMDTPIVRMGLDDVRITELVYLRIDRQIHRILTRIEEGRFNGDD